MRSPLEASEMFALACDFLSLDFLQI